MRRGLLWAGFAGLLGLGTALYLADTVSYGQLLSWSGEAAVWLLLLTLAISPLRRNFPRLTLLRAMRRRRRDLGLITFGCALLHVLVYLERKSELGRIVAEAKRIDMLLGWLAFAVFGVLALTSNDFSVERLGRRWQTLHSLVHGAAALSLAHWVSSAYDPTVGWLCASVYTGLVALRFRRAPRGQVAG